MGNENEIVFEDLRGGPEDKPVQVDLDAGLKDKGITTPPAGEAAEAGAGDDDIKLEPLGGAAAVAPDPDDKGDVASKAGEDDDYSKKVKARIQRATRGEKKAKQEASYWEGQARTLAKDSYEREKKSAEGIIERADTLIASTQTSLEEAIEGGKTKDQVRLTAQLTDQKAEKIRAEVTLDNLPPDGNVQPFSGRVEKDTSGDGSKAASWMEDQRDWYGAKGFERQTRLANRLDREVMADGFDPTTDEYFEELDSRIKEKQPNLYDDAEGKPPPDDDNKDKGKKPKSIVAPVGGADDVRRKTSDNKVDLGERDFAVMREFNLDPNDPAVLKEFARNKQEAEAGEAK